MQEIPLLRVDFLQNSTRFQIGPKSAEPQSDELFGSRLDQLLNMNHPLIKLAGLIDWEFIETSSAAHFVSERGRPSLPPRLATTLEEGVVMGMRSMPSNLWDAHTKEETMK